MNMFALQTERSLRHDTPRYFEVLPCAEDLFRVCSCLVASRRLQSLLSVLTPFAWSMDKSGQNPVDMAQAARCASILSQSTTPEKYPFLPSAENARLPAYFVFHLSLALEALQMWSFLKWCIGRSSHKNRPVSGSYSRASLSVRTGTLAIPRLYARHARNATNFMKGLRHVG